MDETLNAFQRAAQGKKMLTLVGIYLCLLFAMIQSNGFSMVSAAAGAAFGPEAMKIYSLGSSLGGPVSVILMPLWGYIGARNPHLKVPLMAVSILIGAAALVLRAFAGTIWIFIISGILWCTVSPGIFVLGFSLIRDIFPAQKAGTYLGLVGTFIGIGSIVGPTLTGAVMGAAGWQAVCHMVWPFLVIGAVMCLLGVRITKAEGQELASATGKMDIFGIICIILFLAPLILGVSLGNSAIPFGTPLSFVMFAVAVIGLVMLVISTRKKGANAIIPAPALADRNTVGLFLAFFFTSFANMMIFFFLPSYILTVMQPTDLGLTPALWSGIVMACFAVANLFLGPIYGKMIAKSKNARTVSLLNCVFRIVVLVCFIVFLGPDTSIWLLVIICLIPGGIYNAAQGMAYTTGVNIMAPAKLRQQSNAVVQMGQTLGSAPGTAVGGIIIAAFGVAQGMPISFVIAACICVVGIIPSLMLRKPAEESQD